MNDPQQVALPPGTVDLDVTVCRLVFGLTEDGQVQLQALVSTEDHGDFRLLFGAEARAALLAGAEYVSALTPDEFRAVGQRLADQGDDDGTR